MIFLSENKHKLFEYSKSFSDHCYKKGFAVILFGDFFFFSVCFFVCLILFWKFHYLFLPKQLRIKSGHFLGESRQYQLL